MPPSIEDLELLVREAHAASQQGSYHRRAPTTRARAKYLSARRALKDHLALEAGSARGYRALASVEEGLLNYPAACSALETAMSLSGARDRRDLKQLARLRECSRDWEVLRLTPGELRQLGDFLGVFLDQHGCDHTRVLTEQWLATHRPTDLPLILEGLDQWGGYCDCEVYSNVVKG